MNRAELQEAMQANYIEYFRVFRTLPKALWHEDAQVTWGLVHGAPGNHVLKARFSAETVHADLDALFAELDQHTDMVRWLLYEQDTPANLGDILGQRGLLVSQGEPCMVCPLDSLPAMPVIDGLEITLVETAAQLDAWRHATGAGFGGGYHHSGRWAEPYRKNGLGSDSNVLHYLGTVHGNPVTSGTMVLAGGIAGLYDVSTSPAYRKRGLGFAITLAHMAEAQRRGHTHAYLRASREGMSVYERLGFKTLFHEQEFIWHSPSLVDDGSD